MPTTTTRFGLSKPDIGQTNWGTVLNTDWDTIDNAAGLSLANVFTNTNTFNNTVAIGSASASALAVSGSANGINPRAVVTNTNTTAGQQRIGLVGAAGDNGSVTLSLLAGKDTSNNAVQMVSGGTSLSLGIGAVEYGRQTTGQFLNQDGLVGSPTFSFISDPDTGVYHVGANDLGLAAGGTLAIEISSTKAIFSGVALVADGSVSAPSFSFGSHQTTGIYQSTANRVGISTGGFLSSEFATSGASDDTHYAPQTWFSANGGEVILDFYSTASVTTAKKIATVPGNAELFLVYGDSGGGATFFDLVMCGGASSTPTTVTSKTIAGSPAARTYSMAGANQMSVAMASGTYTIRTYGIGVV